MMNIALWVQPWLFLFYFAECENLSYKQRDSLQMRAEVSLPFFGTTSHLLLILLLSPEILIPL